MNLSSEQKRLLRWVGFPLLILVTFVFAAFYTFPYERLGDWIEGQAAKKNWVLSIGDISPRFFPGNVTLSDIEVRTIPTKPEETPMTIWVDEVKLDIGIIAAITGGVDVDIEALVGDGVIEGEIEKSSSRVEIAIDTEALPLATLPGLRYALGDLPMLGGLDASVKLELPSEKKNDRVQYLWSKANGNIDFGIVDGVVGDGKTKIKLRPRPGKRLVFKEGITVPRLNLGELTASIEISDGRGTINEFKSRSLDGELDVDGEIKFVDPVGNSEFPACVRFKFSPAFLKREKNFGSVETMLSRAKQTDGTYALPTQGKLSNFRFNVKRKCKNKGERPTLKPPVKENKPTTPVKPSTPLIPPPTPGNGAPAVVSPPPTEKIPPPVQPDAAPPEPADPPPPQEETPRPRNLPSLDDLELDEDPIVDERLEDIDLDEGQEPLDGDDRIDDGDLIID